MKLIKRLVLRVFSCMPERLLAAVLPARFGFDPDEIPRAIVAPTAAIRLYIAPANSAGQGWQWARAAERRVDGVAALSMTTVLNDVFRFPIDYQVPLGVYRWSHSWQRSQASAVEQGFTHVLAESGKRLFGDGFPGSLASELRRLQDRGLSVAMLFHGSDIRLPSRHASANQWSPFRDNLWDITPALERITSTNERSLREVGVPAFVSTPDLLIDVPDATWLPVVVDMNAWATDAIPFSHGGLPRVAHAPSKAVVKGSDLIDPILARLHDEGLLHYERIEGVAAAEMPAVYTGVDIVLDQFRIGNYGVAACEAMAAGRIVVSHVTGQVRNHVEDATGLALPVVEATVDTLEETLTKILAEPDEWLAHSKAGVQFVGAVHDGRRSAEALRDFLSRTG